MKEQNKNKNLRSIPGMDIVLAQEWTEDWIKKIGRSTVKKIINSELSVVRSKILKNENEEFLFNDFKNSCIEKFNFASKSNLKRIINATGVVIHTNLGRSLIAKDAIKAMVNSASYYSNLEYDIENGTRGQRNSHVEDLLCALTGAESSLVVNNNAGAVMLSLCALAKGSEVIVSRGELVEIGGSFRIPDIMSLSGAKLIEVGTTNRTHLKDYSNAITDQTSILLKVHPSNFRIEGFTSSPERKELSELAHEKNLIFMEDAGSGLLINGDLINLPANSKEITIKSCLEQGVDIATFSGDKILGGPQIGGIAGRKDLIKKIKTHPMARALRVDKSTLSAFEETLRIYLREDFDEIPTLRMLRKSIISMKEQAENLVLKLKNFIKAEVKAIKVDDAVGGGSCPEMTLEGWGVSVKHSMGAGQIQNLLRKSKIPVLCGAHEDEIIIHLRTLQDGEDEIIIEALAGVLNA